MTVQSLRDASMEAQIQWSKQQYDRGYNEAAIIIRDQVRAEDRDEVMKLIETCRSENMSDTQTLQRIIDMISSKIHMQSSSDSGCSSADGK
ncbi:hypothetical protein [Anaerobiospirillum sp. NML120449]|uniref:hypothetical protein n=1 Tax=Anaerobiospirillum sp. NML120449 TaxID=2932817 RepID=UPI001FF20C1C|nr:hypothetical protein [Anaerobiospirillum sp. NML120449]MCK0527202.1 hypothetical protein [Anaerobiospirillum sp. NML120449]